MFKVTDNEHDRVPDELLKSVINRDTGVMGNICFMHILQMAREIQELRYQVGIARHGECRTGFDVARELYQSGVTSRLDLIKQLRYRMDEAGIRLKLTHLNQIALSVIGEMK